MAEGEDSALWNSLVAGVDAGDDRAVATMGEYMIAKEGGGQGGRE